MRASLVAITALLWSGCVTPAALPSPPVAPAETPEAPEPLALPTFIVSTSRTTLHLPEDHRVRVAAPRRGLPLTVREANGNEVLVETTGALKAAGAAPLDTLGVVVCEPGPIGDRYYAGNGNVLSLRSGIHDGKVKVAGSVVLRVKAWSKDVPYAEQFVQRPFDAELPVSRLCAAPLPPRHAGTAEDPTIGHGWGEPDEEDFPKDRAILDVEKNESLAVRDRPDGEVLHTLPAQEWGFTVIRLRHEGAWDQVAVGGGPYLLGWIPARSPRDEANTAGGLGLVGGTFDPALAALSGKDVVSLPLRELPAGTELQQLGVPRAKLQEKGYARVVRADGEWSYVIAAIDGDVTAQGWVKTETLGPEVKK